MACTGGERLSAEILTAYFAGNGETGTSDVVQGSSAQDNDGSGSGLGAETQELERVEAYGGVEILTSTDRAEADTAVYYAQDEIAFLNGNVKISQGSNQLNGTAAEYDLVTRIFRVENARMYYIQQGEEAETGQAPCLIPQFEFETEE